MCLTFNPMENIGPSAVTFRGALNQKDYGLLCASTCTHSWHVTVHRRGQSAAPYIVLCHCMWPLVSVVSVSHSWTARPHSWTWVLTHAAHITHTQTKYRSWHNLYVVLPCASVFTLRVTADGDADEDMGWKYNQSSNCWLRQTNAV